MAAGSSGRLFAGCMSGTSADGVDVALVRIDGDWATSSLRVELLHHEAAAYSDAIRASIFKMRGADALVTLREVCELSAALSRSYAAVYRAALEHSGVDGSSVCALGTHGQTMFHAPPLTLQLVDAPLLALLAGVDVVSEFRRADCAAGGQGAPLVPFTDFVLFRHASRHRVLVNLGGIANITVLPAGCADPAATLAFDTGPANCISDAIIRESAAAAEVAAAAGGGGGTTSACTCDACAACLQRRAEACRCDEGGRLAALGHASTAIVDAVAAHSYFTAPPPKSTDTPQMLACWRAACVAVAAASGATHAVAAGTSTTAATDGAAAGLASVSLAGGMSVADQLATACAVTARTLSVGIQHGCRTAIAASATGLPIDVVVSGGGVFNATLMACIRSELAAAFACSCRVDAPEVACTHLRVPVVTTSDDLGMPAAAKEAVAFAILAAACVDRVPGNMPSCTGASERVVCGSLTPKPV